MYENVIANKIWVYNKGHSCNFQNKAVLEIIQLCFGKTYNNKKMGGYSSEFKRIKNRVKFNGGFYW